MKTFLIGGVPRGLQQDGWWVNAAPSVSSVRPAPSGRSTPTAQGKSDDQRDNTARQTGQMGLLAALIALGDVLIWQVVPGVSLAVFAVALVLAALVVSGRQMAGQKRALVLGGVLLAVLPLVETVNPLSFVIATSGVSLALAVIAGLRAGQLARGVARLWPLGVRQTVADGLALVRGKGRTDVPAGASRWAMAWGMPLGGSAVFVMLLLSANPVANAWVRALGQMEPQLPDAARMMFWLCLVPLCWTALCLPALKERLRSAPRPAHMGPAPAGWINPASVKRALLLFNLLFALQTGMDVFYLYGGAGLPDVISYAAYAHRGAYPLVVTGLLAGGFALLARPWVQGDGMLRVLAVAFVAQNVALVVSSIVRLEMYVTHYGLTHMRVAAGIWMGLTAAGLGLILWQITRRHENTWLVQRGGAMTAGVLYLCAWVPFDAVIARHNLEHQPGRGMAYVCALGDAAKPVIKRYAQRSGRQICGAAGRHVSAPQDWREWGWRNARARSSLSAPTTEPRP